MTKLLAVHELIYEEKARKLLDFRTMEIHVHLITKRKNISKESKIIWSFYKNSIQVGIFTNTYFLYLYDISLFLKTIHSNKYQLI